MDLTYKIQNQGASETIFFSGHINEDAEVVLTELKNKLTNACVFNLANIKSINSCGVRAWINFLREAEKTSSIIFDECTPEIVSQINMIPSFKGKAKIRSVYASYICENCDSQKLELFKDGENLPKKPNDTIAQLNCPKCKQPMEMEELEEEFFGWLDVG